MDRIRRWMRSKLRDHPLRRHDSKLSLNRPESPTPPPTRTATGPPLEPPTLPAAREKNEPRPAGPLRLGPPRLPLSSLPAPQADTFPPVLTISPPRRGPRTPVRQALGSISRPSPPTPTPLALMNGPAIDLNSVSSGPPIDLERLASELAGPPTLQQKPHRPLVTPRSTNTRRFDVDEFNRVAKRLQELFAEEQHIPPSSLAPSSLSTSSLPGFITPPQDNLVECTTCTLKLDPSDFPQGPQTCRDEHESVTCRACWHEWLESQVSQVRPDQITCSQCRAKLDQHDVKALAEPEVYERYLDAGLKALLSGDEDFMWCLSPACSSGQLHDGGDIFTCSSCGLQQHEFCWICLASYDRIYELGNTAHEDHCEHHSDNLDNLVRHRTRARERRIVGVQRRVIE
ncbi:hypothetical protein PRZ48_013915 [Zasmidium cellare]|uniref:RING-type domain-containing protein n=1 Tax=Zasmidium cellare TaxID=395010 RepID=A0ABR0DZG5_ZASCE|nr:hypothetical protein PRZ48_013915 [Zasmidium cellare]